MGNWKTWLSVIVLYLMVRQCGGCDGNNEAEVGESSGYEQTSESYNKQNVNTSFSFESNVRDYLNSHRFSSNDGYTITFVGGMNEMYVNGQIFSGYTEIVSFSRNSATLRANGPSTKITMYLDAANGVLTERSDGTKYYAN